MMPVLGLDIGGSKIAGAIVDRNGQAIGRQTIATPAAEGAPAVLRATIGLCGSLLEHAARLGLKIAAIGVGTAGQVDAERGIVTYAGDTLRGWAGMPIADEIGGATGLPVAVENDVNALALGEVHYGAGRGFADVLCIAVGTGLGGALVLAGKLRRGATHTAGEVCHLVVDWDGQRRCSCGATGHLEAYTCGPAIARAYSETVGLATPLDLRAVADRARNGDALARQAIADGAHILGLGIGGLLNVLDPQVLIVGGGVAELGEVWWQPLLAALRANPLPGPARIPVLRAQLGQDAVLIGAACWAAERYNLCFINASARAT